MEKGDLEWERQPVAIPTLKKRPEKDLVNVGNEQIKEEVLT
jgi:hypothetical protein